VISWRVRSQRSRADQLKLGVVTNCVFSDISHVLLSSVPAFCHCELNP
jgi:hypothetical protein